MNLLSLGQRFASSPEREMGGVLRGQISIPCTLLFIYTLPYDKNPVTIYNLHLQGGVHIL